MKEFVTWNDVEEFIDRLVLEYEGMDIPGVYGLPRGGLVFAVMLSHRLNIPMLASPVKNCLIVDDICDTGESLIHYVKNSSGDDVNNYHIVTMYYKPNRFRIVPEFWQFEKQDKWIIFPWEEKED